MSFRGAIGPLTFHQTGFEARPKLRFLAVHGVPNAAEEPMGRHGLDPNLRHSINVVQPRERRPFDSAALARQRRKLLKNLFLRNALVPAFDHHLGCRLTRNAVLGYLRKQLSIHGLPAC